jgi:hypothetical protein
MDLMPSRYAVSASRAAVPPRTGRCVARHHLLRCQLDHLLETGNPILGSAWPRAPDRADVREGAHEVVSGHQDTLLRQPDRDGVRRLAGCVQQLQSYAGNRQQQLVTAERARGRQVRFPSRRRDPPIFHLNAGVDVHRLGQRHAELVTAIAPGAADVRHRLDEPQMAKDLRMIRSGKDTRAAGVVGVGVGVDDRLHRRAEAIAERGPDGARGHRVGGRVHDDRPGVALDQDHVAGRITHGHVHTVGDPDHFLTELV